MSSNSTDECAPGDTLCVVRVYEQEVIIVPTLLLSASFIVMFAIFLLRVCPQCRRSRTTAPQPTPPSLGHARGHARQHDRRPDRRRDLRGVDAPAEFDVMEQEVLPMTTRPVQNHAPPTAAPPPAPPGGWEHGAFSQLTALPQAFSLGGPGNTALYRARLHRTRVVLRVLRDTADGGEREDFLGFASFLSGLGPHPFLPALVGVVSVAPPLVMAVEELRRRDLLDFLWRCRRDSIDDPCDLTEKNIFTMAGQVASALEYLHGRSCIHGNVAARSVLIGGDLTAKLWGLGPAYHRARRQQTDTEMRKWQSPEVLAGREVTASGDVWSFGVLLFEMVTLGDAPFADVLAVDLLQQLQRGKTLRRPANCSNALSSVIRSCCRWAPQQRPPLAQLLRKLRSGEKSADGRTVLRVPEPTDIERYLREAGYGEAYNYAVL